MIVEKISIRSCVCTKLGGRVEGRKKEPGKHPDTRLLESVFANMSKNMKSIR
jgi:hypothetical protein